jgi:hypothetical protein
VNPVMLLHAPGADASSDWPATNTVNTPVVLLYWSGMLPVIVITQAKRVSVQWKLFQWPEITVPASPSATRCAPEQANVNASPPSVQLAKWCVTGPASKVEPVAPTPEATLPVALTFVQIVVG